MASSRRCLTAGMSDVAEPRAPRVPTTTTYHGVAVTEHHRWLEDAASDETVAWTQGQRDQFGDYLDGIPWRDELRARVEQVLTCERSAYHQLRVGGQAYVALKEQAPRQQPFLVVLTDPDDLATERVVLDPVAIDPTGETSVDFFVPSPDGRRVAVSLSAHGSEDGSLHVDDLTSGELVDEPIPHVNLMGGSAAWHHAGRLTTKQNCFNDLIACADHLVRAGVASRDRLAIMGGSNGGLVVGAVLTQRPDVARAVMAMVPITDSLRSETTANGRFNVTEFGTVADRAQFAALLAYSPYHNVEDGTPYPAVLLTAGENDVRVESWHAKKMAAPLLEATSSERPFLLRMGAAGHFSGSLDQEVEEVTDRYASLFDQLGVRYPATPR